MTQSIPEQDNEVSDFLAHFGIKGMHWGIRRADGPAGTVSSNPANKGPAEDAVRAASTRKAIKKGGTSAVSNSELQHLLNRMNLEKQFAEFDKSAAGKLDRVTKRVLKYGGTVNDAIKFSQTPAGKLLSAELGLGKLPGGAHKGVFDPTVKRLIGGKHKLDLLTPGGKKKK